MNQNEQVLTRVNSVNVKVAPSAPTSSGKTKENDRLATAHVGQLRTGLRLKHPRQYLLGVGVRRNTGRKT